MIRTRHSKGPAHRWAATCAVAALATLGTAATAGSASASSSPSPSPTASSSDKAVGSSSSAGGKLSWAPPKLSSPTTIQVTSRNGHLKLDLTRDYVIRMPSTPVSIPGGLIINGGHNVVLIGGEVKTSGPDGKARGLYLSRQTGTVHVEGLRLSGSHPNEGINLDERRGATVQLQNIAVETVHGSYTTNHADVLQTWSGPKVLRVDRLDGSTSYQGFFLDPGKFGHAMPSSFEFRNTVLRDAGGTSKFLLWQSGHFRIDTSGVTVVSHQRRTAGQIMRTVASQASWSDVRQGTTSTPSPLTGNPGCSYTSPGYADGSTPPSAGPSAAPSADPSSDPSSDASGDPSSDAGDTAEGAPVVESIRSVDSSQRSHHGGSATKDRTKHHSSDHERS